MHNARRKLYKAGRQAVSSLINSLIVFVQDTHELEVEEGEDMDLYWDALSAGLHLLPLDHEVSYLVMPAGQFFRMSVALTSSAGQYLIVRFNLASGNVY